MQKTRLFSLLSLLTWAGQAPAQDQASGSDEASKAPAAESTNADEAPEPKALPPHYHTESTPPPPAQPKPAAQPAPPTQRQAQQPQAVYEPPPPMAVYEPPPPPKPRHVAPKTALWLGARLGWFIPFGHLWYEGAPAGGIIDEIRWSEYASSGPMFQLDAGARLGRNYNVYAFWERAELGEGSADVPTLGAQTRRRHRLLWRRVALFNRSQRHRSDD